MKDKCRRFPWMPDLIAVACLFFILLFPTSGFKNAVVWLGFVYVCVRAFKTRRMLHAGGLGAVLLVFFTVCLASAWYSIDQKFSFRQISKLVEFMAGYLVVVNVLSTPGRVGRALTLFVFAVGAVVVSDLAWLVFSFMSGTLELLNGRWFDSLLGYPTIAAGSYAVAFILVAAELMRSSSVRQRMICAAILIGIMALLYFLQSRSALLGLVAGTFLFVMLAPISLKWRASALGTVMLLIALFAMIPGSFGNRILQGGSSDRAALWRDAGEIVENGVGREPLRAWVGFGYGHKIFEKLHGVIPRHRRHAERAYDHTHNLFIELRVQTGYLGMAAFAGLILAASINAIRRFPSHQNRDRWFVAAGMTGAFVAFFLYGQFSLFFAFLPALMFWTLLAAWMASVRDAGLDPDT